MLVIAAYAVICWGLVTHFGVLYGVSAALLLARLLLMKG